MVWRFWIAFAALELTLFVAAIFKGNPIIFWSPPGMIPWLLAKAYWAVHDPFYKIEEKLEEYGPDFLARLDREVSDRMLFRPKFGGLSKIQRRNVLLLLENLPDPQLTSYAKNVNAVRTCSDLFLAIWFTTGVLLVLLMWAVIPSFR